MDMLYAVFDWYTGYAFVVMPLLIAVFVLGVSLGMFQLTDDRLFHLSVLLLVGVLLLTLSYVTGEYGAELFLNLSAQLFMALLALLIVGLVAQFDSWSMPIALMTVIAVALQLFVTPAQIGTNPAITLGTSLVGATVVAYLLRQEWAWSPVRQGQRLSAHMRRARKQQAEQDAHFGDFFMLVPGHDPAEIKQRIDFLRQHDMTLLDIQTPEYDEESETYYCMAHVKIVTVVKDQDAVLLKNNEAQVRVLAYEDISQRIVQQIGEVLTTRQHKTLDAPDGKMHHLEFIVDAPARLYSTRLEEQIYALARTWQYGDDPILQHASDNLLMWAVAEGLITQ
ncbi:MAG: hypothetical protein ACFE0Q_08250 [Anaerolineae bacterium]